MNIQQLQHVSHQSTDTIRTALRANAAFSAFFGLVFTIASPQITTEIGLENASWFILFVGLNLLPFAAFLYFVSTRRHINRVLIRGIIAMDFGWVIGSVILLATNVLALNSTGNTGMMAIAVIVLTFATWQIIGFRRMNGINEI